MLTPLLSEEKEDLGDQKTVNQGCTTRKWQSQSLNENSFFFFKDVIYCEKEQERASKREHEQGEGQREKQAPR